jgi:cytochrome c-type biogenesis protein CcmE
VLAKHDENYMPPEAAQAIEQARKRSAMTLPSMQETRQ